jgi:hypothetical protein
MPQPNRFAVRNALALARLRSSLALILLAAVSLGWLVGGIACLYFRWSDARSGPLLAPAGVVLVLSALVQWRLADVAWRAGRLTLFNNPLSQFRFWRLFLSGTVLAYLAALALGPVRSIGCAWIAAVCVWQTLLYLPLTAALATQNDWRRWTQGHVARRLALLVYASILFLIAGELGLRVHRFAFDGMEFSSDYTSLSAVPHSGGPSPGSVAHAKRARLRVAVLGDGQPPSCESRGYLASVEQTVPDVEIVRLAASLTGAGVGEVAGQVRHYDPDLVLAVLPVCQDLARKPVEHGYFDWRRFELAMLMAGPPAADEPLRLATAAADFESFLGGLRPQLAACRTPIDDAMRIRWNHIYASLDQVIASCRDAGVPVALVIVPAEFQVDRGLRQTLLRRNGLAEERFDVDLPQRRLGRFAEHRQVPLIDLLPHLRLCRQSVYRRHTTVLSDEGNLVAASAIGGWLESRYGLRMAAQLSATPKRL